MATHPDADEDKGASSVLHSDDKKSRHIELIVAAAAIVSAVVGYLLYKRYQAGSTTTTTPVAVASTPAPSQPSITPSPSQTVTPSTSGTTTRGSTTSGSAPRVTTHTSVSLPTGSYYTGPASGAPKITQSGSTTTPKAGTGPVTPSPSQTTGASATAPAQVAHGAGYSVGTYHSGTVKSVTGQSFSTVGTYAQTLAALAAGVPVYTEPAQGTFTQVASPTAFRALEHTQTGTQTTTYIAGTVPIAPVTPSPSQAATIQTSAGHASTTGASTATKKAAPPPQSVQRRGGRLVSL